MGGFYIGRHLAGEKEIGDVARREKKEKKRKKRKKRDSRFYNAFKIYEINFQYDLPLIKNYFKSTM